ncbi:MAG: CDP-alcohol phosphatidyltransferase family protein [Massilibacteroides sp.]|nr:CDP-alcohol phosphatidyltransferase family protein [Massilibacteroides sp.]
MKNLPNILSISRIIISCLLFFLGGYPVLFSVLYIYCGISDVADGYIARRWKVESLTGAKLDSLGDVILYVLITTTFFFHTMLLKEALALWLVVSVFIMKILNIIITKARFKQWGMMHTIGNKIAGLVLYFLLPLYILIPLIPLVIGVSAIIIALLSTIEETLILLTTRMYNLNRKSILIKK